MKKTAKGIYHNNLESVKNTLKYTRLAITNAKQDASFTDNDPYLITFTDSEYIKTKSGFNTVKIIIAYDCSRFAALLAYWTLSHDDLPNFKLDFTQNITTIYNLDHDTDLLTPINLGKCDADNINLNLNNFTDYLRMDVYDDIKIMRIIGI